MELPEHTHKTAQDIKHPVSGEHGEDGVALCPSGGEGSGGAELLLCIPVGKVVAGSQPQPVSVVNHIIADKPPSADQEAESRNHKPPFQPVFPVNLLFTVGQAAQGKDKNAAEQKAVSVQI